MKRNHLMIAITAALAIALFTYGCKTTGMAVTTRGQLFKININAPESLPEGASDNVDIVLSNRGVNNIRDILVDVELPSQLVVLDQTNDRGIDVLHNPGSNVYHFTIPRLNPAQDANIRYHVRTSFGPATEATIAVTAWQKDLPNDKLFRKTVIKLRT